MPETPEQFWERARTGLRTPPVEEWDSWPFAGAPIPRELEPPVEAEPPRHGVGGTDCGHCKPTNVVWSDANWVLRSLDEPSGLPVVVLLETRRHVDFPDLDDELAAELGRSCCGSTAPSRRCPASAGCTSAAGARAASTATSGSWDGRRG